MRCRIGQKSGALLCSTFLGTVLTAGCAKALRPVPADAQLVARAEAAGVVLQVPRLEHKAYPDRVLSVAAAVYVLIENNSSVPLQISREDFTLGPPNGLRERPLTPRRILVRRTEGAAAPGLPASDQNPRTAVRAILIAGPVVAASPGAPTSAGAQGSQPPPQVRSDPAASAGVDVYSSGWLGLGRPFWGPGWGVYGVPWGYYMGPPYFPRPSRSIIQTALQNGQLPPASSTAGFVYFAKLTGPDGSPLVLHWQVRDARTRQSLGEIELQLELDPHP